MKRPAVAAVAVAIAVAVAGAAVALLLASLTDDAEMTLRSTAFEDGGAIPERYACEGDNLSPPLTWDRVPADAAELALVVADPDDPQGVFHHWVVLGVPPRPGRVGEGSVPPGGVQARGSSENATWIGPCPAPGQSHEYVFSLYPLDRKLGLAEGVDLAAALEAIVDARIPGAEAVLRGRYRAVGSGGA